MDTQPLPRLLDLSPAGGCGCKLPLDGLNYLMDLVDGYLGGRADPSVVVGSSNRDDGALYQLGDHLLVASVDFGTPISDHAGTWGKIGALNALSDVYAMGGIPLFALSIVGWPAGRVGRDLSDLMDGVTKTLEAERTALVGGHTITSQSPIFGLAVTGLVQRNEVMLVRNARPGQLIILTKPLGTGVITAAQKLVTVASGTIIQSESVMLLSNGEPGRQAVKAGIKAATDISGYGIIGHLHNMLKASGCAATLVYDSIPLIPDAFALIADHGVVPNSAEQTYMTLEASVNWTNLPCAMRMMLCDPQTSGGLLLCADPQQAEAFLEFCDEKEQLAVVVGQTESGAPGLITVVRNASG